MKSGLDFFILTKLSARAIIDGVPFWRTASSRSEDVLASYFAEEELS
jgi:hypothetical protein